MAKVSPATVFNEVCRLAFKYEHLTNIEVIRQETPYLNANPDIKVCKKRTAVKAKEATLLCSSALSSSIASSGGSTSLEPSVSVLLGLGEADD